VSKGPVRYYARRSMTYGPGAGEPLDRGQLFDLAGMINDEKLIRLNYVVAAPKNVSIVQCGYCGAEFITDETLNAHGRYRHRPQPTDPRLQDEREDRREKLENELAPLHLDKTAASRGYARSPGR